jgi:hypothetical protein
MMVRTPRRLHGIWLLGAIVGASCLTSVHLQASMAAQELPTGNEVAYAELDGSVSLAFTVLEIVDPYAFTGTTGGPAEGNRFVAVRLTVENTGTGEVRFNPNDVKLHDSRDVLLTARRVTRSQEERANQPDLALGAITAGESVEGFIFYELPQDAEIRRILIQPAFDRLVVLAEAGGAPAGASAGAESPAETSVDLAPLNAAGSFQAAAHGFSVSWDPAVWWAGDAVTAERYDRLRLEAGATAIFVEGIAGYAGDPRSCLADAVEGIRADEATRDFAPAQQVNPPTVDGLLPEGAGLYAYTHDDGDGQPESIVTYLACRTLVAGESVLLVTVVSRARYYELDRDLVMTVIAGITTTGG